MEDDSNRENCVERKGEGVYERSVFSIQFFCKSKTPLKY